MLKIVHDDDAPAEPEAPSVGLDELCRLAAREMLAVVLLAERRAYLDDHAEVLDEGGKRMVVGNGYARQRSVMTGAGIFELRARRVDDRREGERFGSTLLPAYLRRSPKVTEVLPLLYLRGLSTGDFVPALSRQTVDADRPALEPKNPSSPRRGRPSWRSGRSETSPRSTTCTGGPTAFISASASKRTGCAVWLSSACAPTARKSWWQWPTATGSHRQLGRAAAFAARPWRGRTRAGHRRRGARVLGGVA